MFRKFSVLCILLTLFVTQSYAQLTDTQIINYARQAHASGKDPKTIASELLAQGVSQDQLQRLASEINSDTSAEQFDVYIDTDRSIYSQMRAQALSERTTASPQTGRKIFGHNIFSQSNLTFEPSMNIATPPDYKLGPGDEVIIDVWGVNQNTIRNVISPDGSIFVSGIGPVYLNGLTINDANSHLQKQFSQIYAGIEGDASYIKLSLGKIRTIQVNVMGEVVTPGTYAVSSFATVFHAMYLAGGVNGIGSLRNIKLVRNNRTVATIDIYDYILKGNSSDFIKLSEGDVIIVPTYERLVNIKGRVKRPMFYEVKKNDNLRTLIEFAGGFTGEAYTRNITIVRYNGTEKEIISVNEADFASLTLEDGDEVEVSPVLEKFNNMVTIKGSVYRSGQFQLTDEVNTVMRLINKAEGLRGDEFVNRAIITREKSDLGLETIPIDLRSIIAGHSPDIELQPNDIVYIPSIYDLMQDRTFSISGAVASPGTYPYADNTTIEDLVLMAGGLLESASIMRVDVARRTKDPKRTDEVNTISRIYTFSLKDGLVVDNSYGFVLEPFDQVNVRFSPGYMPQKNVYIEGEVLYSGTFALSQKTERLSDLVKKAGGLTTDAYPQGARIVRRMNEDELLLLESTLNIKDNSGKDSVAVEKLDLAKTYNVGIELDKALEHPGSDYDMVLREGDLLLIPEYSNTVKIRGAILHSNTVLFREKEPLRYYINKGGGYSSDAKKSKVYVVHMNGTVSRYRNKKDIRPGSEIIVPSKAEKRRLSIGEVLSIGTTAASIGTMGAAITNVVR